MISLKVMEFGNTDNTPTIQRYNLSKVNEDDEKELLMTDGSVKECELSHQTREEWDISVTDNEIRNSPNMLEENSNSEEKGGTFWFRLKKDNVFRKKYLLTSAYIMSFISLVSVRGFS